MNGPAPTSDSLCSSRAISSFPVPVSPVISTGRPVRATLNMVLARLPILGELPKITSNGGKAPPSAEKWSAAELGIALFKLYSATLYFSVTRNRQSVENRRRMDKTEGLRRRRNLNQVAGTHRRFALTLRQDPILFNLVEQSLVADAQVSRRQLSVPVGLFQGPHDFLGFSVVL